MIRCLILCLNLTACMFTDYDHMKQKFFFCKARLVFVFFFTTISVSVPLNKFSSITICFFLFFIHLFCVQLLQALVAKVASSESCNMYVWLPLYVCLLEHQFEFSDKVRIRFRLRVESVKVRKKCIISMRVYKSTWQTLIDKSIAKYVCMCRSNTFGTVSSRLGCITSYHIYTQTNNRHKLQTYFIVCVCYTALIFILQTFLLL